MKLPSARGPLSAVVLDVLAGRAELRSNHVVAMIEQLPDDVDLVTDEDVQLTLWVLYELSYAGFEDADHDREWDPDLLRVRRRLEELFETELRRRTRTQVAEAMAWDGDLAEQLFNLTETFEGPSLARYLHREATEGQFIEFMKQRSIYHLKESNPSSWVIPRISGKPQAALVELLYDEYGGGRPERLHATMFGDSLEACGLDRAYGYYIDQVPGYTLAVNNAMSLFGLHRRLRGASMGHLGAFEATSSIPCRKISGGIRRLGLPEQVAAYFDEHIEADAVHEQLVMRDICGEMVEQDPSLREDVFFGATVCLYLDTVAAQIMLGNWADGGSALHEELAEAVA